MNAVPEDVKYEPAVPSGPTKTQGPPAVLLTATWKRSDVPAGTSAVHVAVPNVVVRPASKSIDV